MQKDALLVQQTLAGDEQAFHRLIIEYQADIYALVLAWVKNPDDAKELVQDVFLKSYRNLNTLKQPEKFYFWLRQIAKYHCQNWQERKRENFVPLNEDLISETPSIDETLILRETLAKVMQAINELPETEKNILKERYLDESSYSELQAKHGLSYKALNMRLLRAKQKVRARVEKLLAGIGIFSWHDALNKMLLGGVEAMKISAKVKIITIGVAAVLVLGGTGVVVRCIRQPTRNTSESIVSQMPEKARKSISNTHTFNKPISSSKFTTSDQGMSKNLEKKILSMDIQKNENNALTEEKTTSIRVTEPNKSPAISEEPARMLQQKFLEAIQNLDFKTIFTISKGKIRKNFEEQYKEPTAEETAIAKDIILKDSWYIGNGEFHFTLSSTRDGYKVEYILKRDNTGWWLVDGIPDTIESTSYHETNTSNKVEIK